MFKILYFACFLLQIPATALFIDFKFDKIPNKLQKMICSTFFILAAVFSILDNGKIGLCAAVILAGLVFAWVGDLALSSSSKGAEFIVGLLSFLLTHCCYIAAFYIAGRRRFSAPFLSFGEAAAVTVILALLFVVKKLTKIKFGDMTVPVFVYAAAISLMAVKAFNFGFRCIYAGVQNAYLMFLSLAVGAVMMMVSDAVLVLILFDNKFNQTTELINDASYYLAQMLFAGSIMLIE